MIRRSPEIMAFITADENIVKTGNPLTLLITDEVLRKKVVADICKALRADAVQLTNGDYLIISSDS